MGFVKSENFFQFIQLSSNVLKAKQATTFDKIRTSLRTVFTKKKNQIEFNVVLYILDQDVIGK